MAKIKRIEADHPTVDSRERGSLFGMSADFPNLAELTLDDIEANPHQARKSFDEAAIRELAATIERHGLQQPIIVRRHPTDDNRYVLVAGERRVRAHRQLGRKTIYAIVTTRDDPEVVSLLENVQRQDLDALELAEGLRKLIDNGGYTHEKAGEVVGMSPQLVSRTLKLLTLPGFILEEYGRFSATVSRSMLMELIDVKDVDTLRELWQRAKDGLLKRDDIREEAGAVKAARLPFPAPAGGHELRRLGSALKTIKANVLALEPLKGKLSRAHRDLLRELRVRIDGLLEDER